MSRLVTIIGVLLCWVAVLGMVANVAFGKGQRRDRPIRDVAWMYAHHESWTCEMLDERRMLCTYSAWRTTERRYRGATRTR